TGSRGSRLVAAVLYACSPRILTTLGAISSEAWPVALAPWILLPVVRILRSCAPDRTPSTREAATAACSSAVAVLCLGAVNAVASLAAVLPAVIWWVVAGACARTRERRRTAWRFLMWWAPAGVLACFWWIGPLLVLGRYSPPFTDYIESAGITTHWFSLGEVLRGTTSWTPYLSDERQAGAALVGEPVFVAATLILAVLGLVGLCGVSRARLPYRRVWLIMLAVGLLVFGVAGPFSPVHDAARSFLDGVGAPLRNLHKFDTLVRLPLVVGVAHVLGRVTWPGWARWSRWAHPERHRPVVVVTAVGLLLATLTAPAWSARLVPVDGYRSVPDYWADAAAWLNDPSHDAASTRTMVLPRAASARQSWGNTRDEPAQALLDVPWVVRDAVPLVPPEAIRGIDGVQREFDTGAASPSLAAALVQQGIGYLLVRSDLTRVADTPGARPVLRTLRSSPGFTEEASFGDGEVRIFRVGGGDGVEPTTAARTVHVADLDVVAGGPEVLPRLAAADGGVPRDRILTGDTPEAGDAAAAGPVTVTDTPALREHSYGTVTSADSAVRAEDDPWRGLNPVHDYPVTGEQTHVRETGGRLTASSSADDPTSFGGAETLSSVSAAVDGDPTTAWYPASGSPVNQTLTVLPEQPAHQLRLTARAQGTALRLQVTTRLDGRTVASSTVQVPVGREKSFTLPPGDADQVDLRITGAFGRAGLSEFSLTTPDGTDVTPRRDIVVPTPEGRVVGRWVLGQEIPEGTMRRTVTVPGTPGSTMTVRVATADCGAVTTVDGTVVACGRTLDLTAGEHTVHSGARWVELVNTAAAADPAATGATAATAQTSDDRIVYTPTSVNPGRAGHLTVDGTSVSLTPVTVNGWSQGWLVPAALAPDLSDAELAAAVTVDFSATTVYRVWLVAGAAAAALLLGVWALLLCGGRSGRGGRGTVGSTRPEVGSVVAGPSSGRGMPTGRTPHPTRLCRLAATGAWAGVSWVLAGIPGILAAAVTFGALRYGPRVWSGVRPPWILLASGGLATLLFTRGPWGTGGLTDGYAGDSPVVQLSLVVCLTCVYLASPTFSAPSASSAPFTAPRDPHHRETARRAGSSTSA
ncbi:alpha-(1-_3)-arabinofuranosyltransferase family protein, partial [uncultured Corynebacterium sp.]|uniref:alpha-(1->3)-arabinofuranosyltransferase domain-containing protein n=1 Tax=uncultured Corynebacterium sp. TaxID=159447 RepID=UPI0025FA1448